jgi:hypothetical protein
MSLHHFHHPEHRHFARLQVAKLGTAQNAITAAVFVLDR